MTPRLICALVALLVAWSGNPVRLSQARGDVVSVRATVERPAELIGPTQVVPWTLVTGLGREDFTVVSDGGPRSIESFSADDAPIAVVVLLDVSASAQININWLLEPLEKFLIPAFEPGDRVSFGRFGGMGLHLDGRFSGDRREMLTAARDLLAAKARRLPQSRAAGPSNGTAEPAVAAPTSDPVIEVESYLNGAFGLGASPAWDAVDAAVTALEAQPGRRAIILVTDGRSTGNVHSLDEAILHAAAADVPVSVVDEAMEELIRQEQAGWARVRPAVFLRSMADNSGGAYADVFGREPTRPIWLDADATKRWLGRVLAQLVADLHKTYTLSFVAPELDGRMHELDVRVKTPGLKVRARRGYLASSRE